MKLEVTKLNRPFAAVLSVAAVVALVAMACQAAQVVPAPPAPGGPVPQIQVAPQIVASAPAAPAAAPAAQPPAAPAAQTEAKLGPTSALLNRLGVDKTSMGIKTVEERDAGGAPAYEIKPGDLLVYTNASADYAATTAADRVVIIDAKTKQIRHVQDVDLQIQGRKAAGHMIGISPNAEYVYLPNRNEDNLFVLDLRTLKTKQVLDLGGRAHHLNVFADRYMLGDAFSANGTAGIYLLDPSNGNQGAGGAPRGDFGGEPYLAFPDPTETFMYVGIRPRVNELPNGERPPAWMSQIDMQTWGEIRTIPVLPGPIWTVFTRDGKYAYVTSSIRNRVEKIEVATGKVVGTAPTGRGPYGAVLSADEKSLYVVSKGEGGNGQRGATFVRIATANMTLDVELPASPVQPNQPDHILLSPDGTELWISNNMGSITVFDEKTLEMKAYIEMPDKGSAHGVTFVQFDERGNGRVVMDLTGPHGGMSPYLYDQAIGRAQASGATGTTLAAAVGQQSITAAEVGARQTFDIVQAGNTFQPNQVTVRAGAPVRFTLRNNDAEEHNIFGGAITFPANQQEPGGTYTVDWVAPTQPGIYEAFCAFHLPAMTMKIVVQ